MSEQSPKRVLEAARKSATADLNIAFAAFRQRFPEEKRIGMYENTINSFRSYASSFAEINGTANPFEHAVASDRNRIHKYEMTHEMLDTSTFFTFFNKFEAVPLIGEVLPESVKRDRAKEFAAFYFDLALNARNGFNSTTREFESIAVADTFFARARKKYFEFEVYQFSIEMKKRKGYVKDSKISEQLVEERSKRVSQVSSLYQVASAVWVNTGATSHRSGKQEHVRLSEKAHADYEEMLRFVKGGIPLISPERVNLEFLTQ